jgi:hypothetical protein
MTNPATILVVALTAFRIVGLGHPIPTVANGDSCPQGRWSQALYAAHTSRRVGTMYGCGLTISKATSSRLDPAWIHQTAREHFVLPGGSVTALCDEWFRWRDPQHSRATFHCRIPRGGTISGAGNALNGRANYRLQIRRA